MTALNLSGRALWIDFRGVPKNWDDFYAAARKAGVRGAIRYIDAGSEGKQIHAAERQAAARNGIEILLVDELGTGDAWDAADDRAAGVARGRGALADAKAEGFGPVGIAAAADAHATARQVSDAVLYATGFASVVTKAWAGFYGFIEVLRAVRAANVVSWFWLCGSMPSAEDARWIAFWQDNRPGQPMVIAGVQCDRNWRLDGPIPGAATNIEENKLSDAAEKQIYSTYAGMYLGSHGDGWTAPPLAPTVAAIQKQLTALTSAVAKQSPATAADIAAALTPQLAAAIGPQIAAAIDDIKEAGAEVTAEAVVEALGHKLAASVASDEQQGATA